MSNLLKSLIFTLSLAGVHAHADDAATQFHLGGDIYAVHTHLLPYKGTEDAIAGTLYFQFGDSKLVPFVRGTYSSYYYLNEAAGNTAYTSDNRSGLGIGLDFNLTSYLRIRVIEESIHNGLSGQSYDQFSYGLIYNQYIGLGFFDLNNYAEAFVIPRVSSGEVDTFARVQALIPIVHAQSGSSSHRVYPFVQAKAKVNDNDVFGVSGYNASVGAGYKWAKGFENKGQLAFLLEGHSLFYQSKDFNGDWNQILATLQYKY
jgi:hypothetical protein